VRSSARVTDWK
jgi:hypothetical protein